MADSPRADAAIGFEARGMTGDIGQISLNICGLYEQRDARIFDLFAAPGMIFWDNASATPKSLAAIKAEFSDYVRDFASAKAHVKRLESISGGFLMQYVVNGMLQDGSEAKDHHVCLIVTIDDGLVVKIEEYC